MKTASVVKMDHDRGKKTGLFPTRVHTCCRPHVLAVAVFRLLLRHPLPQLGPVPRRRFIVCRRHCPNPCPVDNCSAFTPR